MIQSRMEGLVKVVLVWIDNLIVKEQVMANLRKVGGLRAQFNEGHGRKETLQGKQRSVLRRKRVERSEKAGSRGDRLKVKGKNPSESLTTRSVKLSKKDTILRIRDSDFRKLIMPGKGSNGETCYRFGESVALLIKQGYGIEFYGVFRENFEQFVQLLVDLNNAGKNDIRRIDLRGVSCTDAHVATVLEHCPKLEELELSDTIGGDKLGGILEKRKVVSSNLQVLDLESCRELSDKRLISLMKACPEIEDLNVSLRGVGRNVFAELLAKSGIQSLKLRRLNLSYCGKLTNESLVAFLEKLPFLKEIDLSFTKIGGKEFAKLMAKHKVKLSRLKKLDVSYCSKLEDADLLALTKATKTLKSLSILATGIGGGTVGKIKKANKGVSVRKGDQGEYNDVVTV